MKKNVIITLLICTSLTATMAHSQDELTGTKHIFMLDKQQTPLQIGTIHFHPHQDQHSTYTLHIDHSQFQDYFLSMKEMKCLEGPELMCQLPYPYAQPRTVSAADMHWLSHDLLFMFKRKNEFGANFWNGIYYDLRLEDGVIKGSAQAVDLNLLASPPSDLSVPPIGEAERDEIDTQQRWLPALVIR